MTIRRRTLGTSLLAVALLSRPSLAQAPRHGGTLVAVWGGGEPQACYVPSGGGPGPTFSSSKVFERLGRRLRSGAFTGELAESWRPAPDFLSYTVKLRPGIVFHDGQPMGADDVIYSIDEIWKKYAAPLWLADHLGCEASSDESVTVKFAKPVPEFFFASLLSGSVNYIVPRHVYEGSDPLANPANDAPVGTGPWRFRQWRRGSHIEFVRNERYWRPEFPYPERLLLRFPGDAAARAAVLETGEVQIGVFDPVAPLEAKRLGATGKLATTTEGYEETVWATTLECNVRRPLMQKLEVRQAIFHAIDRSEIANAAYSGYARPGTGPIFSPNTAFYTADTPRLDHDPRKAASLLDAAGLTKKAGGKRFALTLVAGGWFAENGRVGALVKQALEALGVTVTLAVPDRAASLRRLYTDYDFDLALSNQANPSEPVPTTTQYYASEGIRPGVPFTNASGFHSPAVDELVGRIKVETDAERRKALLVDFQKIIAREAVCLPLVELKRFTVASDKVRDYANDPDTLASSWHDIWLAS